MCLYVSEPLMFFMVQVLLPRGLSAQVDSAWAGVIKNNPARRSFGQASRHLQKAKLTVVWHLMLQKFPLAEVLWCVGV